MSFSINIGQMLVNLSQSYEPIMRMLTGGAYVMGMAFAMLGVYQLKSLGEQKSMMSSGGDSKLPLVYFLIAAVFLYLPTAIDTLMMSTFGSTSTPIDYAAQDQSVIPSDVYYAILRLIQIVGLIAFIRGWFLLMQSAKNAAQPALGRALTHIIGGILAINVIGTMQMLSATFGLST